MRGLLTRRQLALAAALAPVALHSRAQAAFDAGDLAHAARLREAGLKSGLAYELAVSLVRDVGPRAAGTPGDALAVRWAMQQMKRLGLSNVRAEPVPFTAWRRGPLTVDLLAAQPQRLVAGALGNSPGTQGVLEAEIAYYPDFAALKADSSTRAQGRIVFIDQKMRRTRDPSGYGEAAPARFFGPIEAARRGAAAVVVRSIGTHDHHAAHTGMTMTDAQVPAIPSLAVSVPDAQRIAAEHAAGRPVRLRIDMHNTREAATTHNVIGEVPGTDLAQEVVLFGAHLDSWDNTPGALDDAAGVGISLAAARNILEAGVRPRRTLRVVLFGNEENGLDGAEAYARQYAAVTHQLVGESDLGSDRIWRVRWRAAPEARAALAQVAEVLAPLGIEPQGTPGTPAPDASVLMRRRGWPAVDLSQDASRYFDVHHTANDTIDKLDPAAMPQNVAAWSVVAWLASQSRVAFGPLPSA